MNRVERGIREGKTRGEVFPRLRGLTTNVEGAGLTVKVRITRQPDAPPVRLVPFDEEVEASAIREVDPQNTYKHGPKVIADKLHIDTGRAKALRWELAIEDDRSCRHDFVFGKMKLPMYSDHAREKMRDAIASGVDLNEVRRRYLAARRYD